MGNYKIKVNIEIVECSEEKGRENVLKTTVPLL